MKAKFKTDDNAKIAASAPQRPKQVSILFVTGSDQAAVRRHDIGRQ